MRDGDNILLGMKKKGFGQDRWNGFGGKVEPGESIEAAAVREMREESGVEVSNLQERGIITFEFEDGQDPVEMHIFEPGRFSGEPAESDEMRPAWFLCDDIPFDDMWPGDRYWIPLFLGGKNFKGRFRFADLDTIMGYELNTFGELEQPAKLLFQAA
jgi:8-oxo-dGTP pyrophosphatase MutT (NUDIX family)